LSILIGLAACGGGEGSDEALVSVDYSTLRIAESRATPLTYARTDEQVLRPLRNGMRLMTTGGVATLPTATLGPTAGGDLVHSATTLQVEGVDEPDSVKYDGRYLFVVRPEMSPASMSPAPSPGHFIDIVRTDPETAGVAPISKFLLEGERSQAPVIYLLQTPEDAADHVLALSQNYQGWLMPLLPVSSLVMQPDRTTIQLLDVRDPQNVVQSWKLELDGWLRASRLIGDTLYLVSSYRPRLAGLLLPADTPEKLADNERRIRTSTASDLMPGYAEDGGAKQQLASSDGCLIAQQLTNEDAYTDLLVIAAINVRTRRVTDVNCLSTNVNGVYMSQESLYVAGTGSDSAGGAQITVLHKFALDGGGLTYRATGAVAGTISWMNPSYFMDEHEGDLRIVTSANGAHRLTVLRETSGQNLMLVSSLPNGTRPSPIGKPGESVYAVRFMSERAYVVTFQVTDPLYVIDLRDPADPLLAGELEIPGFSTYLRPLGKDQAEMLLSVGQEVGVGGRREGIKVQLFDVRDITRPQVIGTEIFGGAGSWSDALDDPHALAFLTMPGANAGQRFAVPIHVFDTAHSTDPGRFAWTYSGLHVFEIPGGRESAPQLRLQGVIKTEEQPGDATPNPTYAVPSRGALHGESVFAIQGGRVLSSLWHDLPSS